MEQQQPDTRARKRQSNARQVTEREDAREQEAYTERTLRRRRAQHAAPAETPSDAPAGAGGFFNTLKGYANTTFNYFWRAGRFLVIGMRAGDSFKSVRGAGVSAPVRIGLLVLGWLPRWAFSLYGETGVKEKDLQKPSIPKTVDAMSLTVATVAGVGAVAGFYWLFSASQAVLGAIPGAGIIAGIATAVYMVMKFHDFNNALTPAEAAVATNDDTEGNTPPATLSFRTRAANWAKNFFTVDHLLGIDSTKDKSTARKAGKVVGTVLTAASAFIFAFLTVSSLPVALPIAIIGCTAYGLGEFFDARQMVADFYARFNSAWQWFRGDSNNGRGPGKDTGNWNSLASWKRGIAYTLSFAISASIAVPVGLLFPPALVIPIGAVLVGFMYPLFLNGVFKKAADRNAVAAPIENDHHENNNGAETEQPRAESPAPAPAPAANDHHLGPNVGGAPRRTEGSSRLRIPSFPAPEVSKPDRLRQCDNNTDPLVFSVRNTTSSTTSSTGSSPALGENEEGIKVEPKPARKTRSVLAAMSN